LAGAADHDAIAVDRDGYGPVALPVLGVHGVVLNRGVEPQPVALLAVVERPLEWLRRASSSAAATPAAAAAAAPAAGAGLVVAGLLVVPVLVLVLVFLFLVLVVGLEGGRHQGVVLGAEVELLVDTRSAVLGVSRR